MVMAEPRTLRFYGYVERPYEPVRALLRAEPVALLSRATTSAAKRAQELVANLRVGLGGVEIGVDVRTTVRQIREEAPLAGLPPVTIVELGWEAVRAPGLFPLMHAQLSAWPTLSTETQLEIEGEYQPPFRGLGNTLDAVLLHRVAQASVHRFLEDVIAQIGRELSA
jgi:hypothetical protein